MVITVNIIIRVKLSLLLNFRPDVYQYIEKSTFIIISTSIYVIASFPSRGLGACAVEVIT
jgi:hypothetical protein